MAVNLSPYGGVGAQFFTNNGVPLAGGKIFTYAAGTTTPQATYTSASGSTAHANPIILDAAGRVPGGEIWLTDGLQYKFVLKDANDITLATYDNVVGINSNFINYTNEQEIQTATAGQTVFTLTTMQYQPGTGSLSVFVDGVNQYGPGAQYAFVETDSTTVTFVTGLHVGASVKFTTAAINAASYGDAFQVSYTPPFTGSAATNVGDKLAQYVSVKDFGAVGDGVTDDTAAIQAAINYAVASRQSLSGMVFGYSAPEIRFTEGAKYLVTGDISVGTGIKLFGNKAIVTSGTFPYPQTNPLFIDVGPDCIIDGLVTFGFTDIVKIATANVDAAVIEIKNCEIQEWSGYAVFVDNNSASTLLKIHDNKFYARSASAWIVKNQCDVCLFDDNWVEGPCDTFFWNTKAMYIRGMLGVPTASTSNSRWIYNEGTALTCQDSRFGGEAGARTIVDQITGPGGTNATKLTVENCEVWSTGFPLIRFSDIPDVFAFTRNYGFNGSYPFQFNTIPSATKNLLGSRNTWTVGENELVEIGGLRSSSQDVTANNKSVMIENVRAALGTATFTFANVVRNILYTEVGFGNTGSITPGMGSGVATDIFGAAVQTIDGINGTSQFNTNWTTLLAGLPAGSYTMLVNIAVNAGASVLLTLNAGNNVRTENLTLGKYTLAVPFYFDGTNAPTCGYAVKNICLGTQIAHGGLRVVSGTVDGYKKWNTECYGTAAPISGYWRLGDRVINSAPTIGQPKSWVCTVAGTPGTWVSEGNL